MRRIALGEIGTRGAFTASSRYGVATAQPANRDRVAEAYQAGLAEGRRVARGEAEAEAAQAASANRAIELAFARFDEDSARLLQERLRETVAAICQSMAGEIAIEPDRLAARVEAAAAMLRRKHDDRLVCLHPDDIALVQARLPSELRLEPDPRLARGQLRVDGEDGGVEDGAEEWRAALAEALGICSR